MPFLVSFSEIALVESVLQKDSPLDGFLMMMLGSTVCLTHQSRSGDCKAISDDLRYSHTQ